MRAPHKIDKLDDVLFARIVKATKDAGRGDVLSYVNVTMPWEVPAEFDAADKAEREYDAHVASVYRAMDAKE